MEKYDYLSAVCADVKDYIKEHYKQLECYDKDELYDELYNKLFGEDSVTDNASGSYTFNAWEAEENLCHNIDLLNDALNEFGYGKVNVLDKGAEWCDVTIRCYLLGEALKIAISDLIVD